MCFMAIWPTLIEWSCVLLEINNEHAINDTKRSFYYSNHCIEVFLAIFIVNFIIIAYMLVSMHECFNSRTTENSQKDLMFKIVI